MIYIIQSIRADLFRFAKMRSIHIMILGILAFAIIGVNGQALGTLGMSNPDDMNELNNISKLIWTADIAASAMLSQMTMVLYFMIVIPVVIVGADFRNQTYKNVITTSITRTQYFIAKSLTILLTTFRVSLLYVVFSAVLAGFMNGWGDIFTASTMVSIFNLFLMKFFFIYANLIIGVAFACLSKNNVVMSLSIILTPFVIQILIAVLNLGDTILKYLDIASATGLVGVLQNIDSLPYFLGSSLLVIVVAIFSLEIFKRSDL